MKTAVEQKALSVLKKLEEHGYEAYLVGGYVRDKLASRPNSDIDIATSAKPPQVMAVFPRTVPTGLKHGTVTVIEQGTPFEVTTFRQESEYEEYRRPKEVRFVTSLEEDLKRRDFTINAMAMDRNDHLIDPFGGQADLQQKILRCVGRAEERFQEDALRMVRCVRFAAEYELEIDDSTWQALLQLKSLMKHIAMERIRVELERIIEGSHPMRGLSLLVESGLLFHLKDDLQLTEKQWHDALLHAELISRLQYDDLRWHHLLWNLGLNKETSRQMLRKLTFSNVRQSAITSLIALTDCWTKQTPVDGNVRSLWIQSVIQFGEQTCALWLEWLRVCQTQPTFSDMLTISPEVVTQLVQLGEEWIKQMPARTLKELNVDGNVLRDALPEAKGPILGQLLHQLLMEAAHGKVSNERKALLSRASELLTCEY